MIVAEGYVEEYHIDIHHEDLYRMGSFDSERIVTGRDLTIKLRLIDFDDKLLRALHSRTLKILVDDRMPVSDDPRPKPIPKRRVTMGW